MPEFKARDFVLHEANLAQLQKLKPNVAVLPWAATEGHNYHLPHGTDVIEANAVGYPAVEQANAQGARCVLLPCIPFGNDNMQLAQVATITMRTRTQYLVLHDVADSLVRQGIDRLVILNYHGGNDFKQMIRDVMMDLPIFIVQIHTPACAPASHSVLTNREGDHANEFETAMIMHINPEWVTPLEQAHDGSTTPSKIPAVTNTPGVWAPRDWAALTESTGVGNPYAATPEKGKHLLEAMIAAVVPVLTQLSAAKNGDFPYIVRKRPF
jgi:creatinine amidohydrolase